MFVETPHFLVTGFHCSQRCQMRPGRQTDGVGARTIGPDSRAIGLRTGAPTKVGGSIHRDGTPIERFKSLTVWPHGARRKLRIFSLAGVVSIMSANTKQGARQNTSEQACQLRLSRCLRIRVRWLPQRSQVPQSRVGIHRVTRGGPPANRPGTHPPQASYLN